MKGKVDLEKIRDIRRAIRRRYANRRKIQKIFQAWDRSHKGYVDINDVHIMLKDLGHKVNFDEARVFLASSDVSGENKLYLDEFLEMIYSENDALNVNIERLNKLGKDFKIDTDKVSFVQLEKAARENRQQRHDNQVLFILKKRKKELGKMFEEKDYIKKGFLNFQQFQNCLKKL